MTCSMKIWLHFWSRLQQILAQSDNILIEFNKIRVTHRQRDAGSICKIWGTNLNAKMLKTEVVCFPSPVRSLVHDSIGAPLMMGLTFLDLEQHSLHIEHNIAVVVKMYAVAIIWVKIGSRRCFNLRIWTRFISISHGHRWQVQHFAMVPSVNKPSNAGAL
jgi:hypothetical protein